MKVKVLSTFKIKRVVNLFATKSVWIIRSGLNHRCSGMTWLASWSDQATRTILLTQVRARVAGHEPLNHQDLVLRHYGSPHAQPTSGLIGRVLSLCRSAVGLFYSPSWQSRDSADTMGWFGLVSLFNAISTLFRLFNAKAILQEEQY